eukprot:TRINITY_DN33907_c0_g1_i1.p1 TRINITY_DN33907_c0_g1~~TRINITY_DN33907_c0_g1_i1.p1  ORF type:complete len:502 (+),score=141.66 TRINITY_DN33907_c0_g1_i1:69-1574(+)
MSDSSSLGSLSSGSDDDKEVIPKQQQEPDTNDSSSDCSSSQLESTEDDEPTTGNVSQLELENNYILQMKWVPDRESLHSFRAGRRFESKYLPLIKEGLKNMPPPPPPKPTKQKVKRDESESSSSSLSSESDSDIDNDADLKRQKIDEEAEDDYILEMGWVPDRQSIASFRNARKFQAHYAQLIKDGLLKKKEQPAQSAQQTSDVEMTVKGTAAEEQEPAAKEGKKKYVPYGTEIGENSNLLMVTRIPPSWFDIEADASQSIYSALESQLQSLDNESREAATLRNKLASLTKSEQPALTDMLAQKLGQDILGGLTSIRPLIISGSFIGTCILRYESQSHSEASWNYICHHHKVSAPADELKMVVANHLVVSMVCAPHLPETKPDGRIARYSLFPPPDIRVKRKRKPKQQETESASTWLEAHYTQGKTQKTPEQVKRAEEDEVVAAAKKDEQDAKLAKVTSFTEFVMVKIGLVQESLSSYMSSRKFFKIKDALEEEYKEKYGQ